MKEIDMNLNDKNNKDNKVVIQSNMTDMLQVVFIVLKLCNVIDWSWFWVLTPLWITLILCFLIYLVQE